MMHSVDADLFAIINNRCPDCGNYGFIGGPRGGAGQNIFCANPECMAAFMVAPRKAPMIVQRVGKAEECHYPPKVHILAGGVTLCRFHGYRWLDEGPPPSLAAIMPVEWPIGHSWVGRDEFEDCTCPQCRKAAAS